MRTPGGYRHDLLCWVLNKCSQNEYVWFTHMTLLVGDGVTGCPRPELCHLPT